MNSTNVQYNLLYSVTKVNYKRFFKKNNRIQFYSKCLKSKSLRINQQFTDIRLKQIFRSFFLIKVIEIYC